MTRASATFAVLGIAAVLGAAPRAWAFGGGVNGESGMSGHTCSTNCHAQTGTPPTVKLSGPTTLDGGMTATYTLEIQNAATAPVGFDVATSGGTLAAVTAQSQLLSGEITHTRTLLSGTDVMIQFSLTAPVQGGMVKLFAAALTSDGNDDEAGDATGNATLAITVNGAAPGADLAGIDLAQPSAVHDEPRWACSFSAAATSSAPALLVACLLALALRRRTRR
jgi:hypothetical protein